MELVTDRKMRRYSSTKKLEKMNRKLFKNYNTRYVFCVTLIAITFLSTQLVTALDTNNNNVNLINNNNKLNTNNNHNLALVLPHDTYPGFSIKKFTTNATTNKTLQQLQQHNGTHTYEILPPPPPDEPSSYKTSSTWSSASSQFNYRLIETGFSKYFTVLDDGLVMTTSDLTPLVNHPVHLVILEESPNSTATHQLQLFVMNRNDMLRFPGANLDTIGEVLENEVRGTRVHGVPLLQANSASGTKTIVYQIVDGNDGDAFAFQDNQSKEMKMKIAVKDNTKSGVWLVTNKPLDREQKSIYTITIQASDKDEINKAFTKTIIHVIDKNDNAPVFLQRVYHFTVAGNKSNDIYDNSTIVWSRFTNVGRVEANDLDGDKVTYKLLTPNNIVIIVPQTGDLLLVGEPLKNEITLEVEAHDLRMPSMVSKNPAKVIIEFVAPEPLPMVMENMSHDLYHQHSHRRDKRRVTRAVRPTKRIEFTEADGDTEGKNVFQLEKETDRETFKIRDENPWVTVEPNGAVRVKKKWDYEELGPEKTIDFWVIITNAGGHNCEYCVVFLIIITFYFIQFLLQFYFVGRELFLM